MLQRRRLLAGICITTIGGLAGCSSSDGNSSSGGGSNAEEESYNDTSENTTNTSETENQFSTEGNDSELIDGLPDELNLEVSDMPGDDWETEHGHISVTGGENESGREFIREEEIYDQVEISVVIFETVDDCQDVYNRLDLQSTEGGILRPDATYESRELGIGVNSRWSFGEYEANQDEYEQTEHHVLKLRDANGFGIIQWNRSGDSLPMTTIGDLGVVMHEKWR